MAVCAVCVVRCAEWEHIVVLGGLSQYIRGCAWCPALIPRSKLQQAMCARCSTNVAPCLRSFKDYACCCSQSIKAPAVKACHMPFFVLSLPGFRGSGPRHWQTIWEQSFKYHRIAQDFDAPLLKQWVGNIQQEVSMVFALQLC